jgi:acyl-CoA thioester hydrolase
MKEYQFKLDFEVRDYECDMQGIINNAIYQNYLEHTRHQYLKSIGLDFADFVNRKINLVITRAEIDYRFPLTSGKKFWVGLKIERVSVIRFAFLQDIYQYPDNKLILNARITGTGINEKGRPCLPEEINILLEKELENQEAVRE